MSNTRPFRFGIAVATDPGDIPSREAWIALAHKTEDLGYATFLVADHFINEYLPIAALMFAADATRTLRVGSYVFDNNYRHPVLLAKEVAAIDRLSGGRFELGMGAGWYRAEYDQVGLTFDRPGVRIQRLEEALAILKQFFTQDSITFAGDHYTVNDLKAVPKPTQRPHPPIFIGGGAKKVLSLAGREADIVGLSERVNDDGSFDAAERTEAALKQKVEWVRQAAGERFSAMELNMLISTVIVTDERQQVAEQHARESAMVGMTAEDVLANPFSLIGTVEYMVETLQRRREELGISYLTVTFRDMEAFAPVVARLADS